jgi:hypothetical protein
MIPLAALEKITGASGIAPQIEAVLPAGVRRRQLSVRTLLAGMCLALAGGRPARLTRVRQVLAGLPGDEQRRLGVLANWKDGPHLLTYRQAGYTFGLVARALGKAEPDGLPSPELQAACDQLLEASVPDRFKDASTSLAVDWSDLETFSRPPPHGTGDCADPEASWGHRRNNLLHDEDELFFGYCLSDAVTVPDEQGPPVPGFTRRMTVSSCRRDPVPAFTGVLTAMPAAGIPLGDVLADSGYSHRVPQHWASPLRQAGAQLVQDLHPHDRGPRAPTTARSSATGTCTALRHPARCCNSGRPPPARRKNRPPATTARPLNSPATSSAASPPTTPTVTTASSAQPLWARSAARSARPPCCWTGTARRSSPRRRTRPLLHPADHHHPGRRGSQDQAETRLSVKSPPPVLRPPHRRRTRLRHCKGPRRRQHQPRLVPPHGPGPAHAARHDPADHPQPAHPGSLEHPATRKRPPRCQRPAPKTRRRRRPRRRTALTTNRPTTSPAPAATASTAATRPKHAPARRKPQHPPRRGPRKPAPRHGPSTGQNVRPKRENRPHRNVKTSGWS